MFNWLAYGPSQDKDNKESNSENEPEIANKDVKDEVVVDEPQGKAETATENNSQSDLDYAKDVAKNFGSKCTIYCTRYYN